MNKMKKNMIIDCSERLSSESVRIEQCGSELDELLSTMSEEEYGEELYYLMNTVRKELGEQKLRVKKLGFVLMSAADVVNDNEKKSLHICNKESTLNNELSSMLIGNDYGASELVKLPKNYLKVNM